jgi:hypothetical protein
MRTVRPVVHAFAAALLASALTASPLMAQKPAAAPQPQAPPQQGQQQPPAKPMPYNKVAIKLPVPFNDAGFVAFRKQLGTIAQKKDRAALARIVSGSFFLLSEDQDAADKKKPGIENLSKALGLDGKDAQGWDALVQYADEQTAEPDPDHKGVMCAPADPTFDENAANALAKATQTDPGEWGYPVKDGVEVRSAGKKDAPVTGKLGLYLVRVYLDDSPAAAVEGNDFIRIVTSDGKLGYVSNEELLPLGGDQLCYVKEGANWKIAGFISGGK